MARAFNCAMSPDKDLALRRRAVVFLGQAGILSLHDLQTHRIVLDRLNRLRNTLGPVRADGEHAVQAVYKHMHTPASQAARAHMQQSLDQNYEKF